MAEKGDYGNWVSKRLIYIMLLFGTAMFAGAVLFWPLTIVGAVFLFGAAYFVYARYLFSSRGGNVQNRIRELVINNLNWTGEGKALDIGCGNAALTIKVAQKYPNAQVVGVDLWGGRWEYSKEACERNAQLEGVSERVTFQKASAVSLPFEDAYFDAVVSNLVFHEVNSPDRREVVKEALRVLKKDGVFAFQDLFLIKQYYGETEDLLAAVQSWGINQVEVIDTKDAEFIPRALKLPFMVGPIALIVGKK